MAEIYLLNSERFFFSVSSHYTEQPHVSFYHARRLTQYFNILWPKGNCAIPTRNLFQWSLTPKYFKVRYRIWFSESTGIRLYFYCKDMRDNGFLFRTKFTSTKLCTFQILRLDVTVFIFQNLAEVLSLEFLISSDCDTWIFINRYESYMQLAQSGNGYRIGQNTHRRNIHKYVNLTSRWLIHQ